MPCSRCAHAYPKLMKNNHYNFISLFITPYSGVALWVGPDIFWTNPSDKTYVGDVLENQYPGNYSEWKGLRL
jgi:hypothetical protein